MEVDAYTGPEALIERLDRGTAAMARASAGVLRDVVEADRSGLWRRDGARSMSSWLAGRYGLAWGTAREWVLESDGGPLRIGRRGRTVSGPLLRVLRHRDGAACRFPGCQRKRWLHAHHLVHWADGGGTNLDTLVLLCHAHHRLIHEGG
jgi:hypothetical protein